MKKNIIVVGLLKDFVKEVARELANKLDMYYDDALGIIEYNLINSDEIAVKCGVDYLNLQEKKVLKSISEYENSVISMHYNLFFAEKNYKMFKDTSIIIYVQVDTYIITNEVNESKLAQNSSLIIDLIDYNDRNRDLMSVADIVIQNKKLSSKLYVKEILKKLNEIVGGV